MAGGDESELQPRKNKPDPEVVVGNTKDDDSNRPATGGSSTENVSAIEETGNRIVERVVRA